MRTFRSDFSRGPYKWLTYSEAYHRAERFAYGLNIHGLGNGSHVAIFTACNSPEWVIAEAACNLLGIVTVPLYEALSRDQVAFILQHSDCSAIICSADKSEQVLDLISASCPSVYVLIEMDDDYLEMRAAGCDVSLISEGHVTRHHLSQRMRTLAPHHVRSFSNSVSSGFLKSRGQSRVPSHEDLPIPSPEHVPGIPSDPRDIIGDPQDSLEVISVASSEDSSHSAPDSRPAPLTVPAASPPPASQDVALLLFSDVEVEGGRRLQSLSESRTNVDLPPPAPHDVASILYNAGDSPEPRGSVLTHSNFIAAAVGFISGTSFSRGGDVTLSVLPLAHAFERLSEVVGLYSGTATGFPSVGVTSMLDDVRQLRPTYIVGVPRIFSRICTSVTKEIRQHTLAVRSMYYSAYYLKRTVCLPGEPLPLLDDAIFGDIRAILGGRLEYVISGGAPLPSSVQDFFTVCFSAVVLQGYGVTEAAAACCMTSFDNPAPGCVGAPLSACCEVKLMPVPVNDRLYRPMLGFGELAIRGANVFRGYHKDPDMTRSAMTADGWFLTGDIACRNADGTFTIIDRKKHILRLSSGAHIAVEQVEGIYTRCPLIGQIFVHGSMYHSAPVAVVFPSYPELRDRLLRTNDTHLADLPLQEMCRNPEIVALVTDTLQEFGRSAGLPGFAIVTATCLIPAPFTTENGMLTANFRLKRSAITEHYTRPIKDMYRLTEHNKIPMRSASRRTSVAGSDTETLTETAPSTTTAKGYSVVRRQSTSMSHTSFKTPRRGRINWDYAIRSAMDRQPSLRLGR